MGPWRKRLSHDWIVDRGLYISAVLDRLWRGRAAARESPECDERDWRAFHFALLSALRTASVMSNLALAKITPF